jgi:hypothetical protein
MRKTIVSRSPAFAAAAFAVALMTALLAGCPQPTDPESTKSNDATLKSLSLKAGETSLDLNPAFDSVKITYTASVPWATASVEVAAEPNHKDAATVISSGGTPVSGAITLNAAGTPTVVTITVTAADGETEKIYEITISRAAPDPESDATLKSLVLQTGSDIWILDPAFASTTFQYTVNVPTTVSAVTILAETSQSNATATPVGGTLNPAGETTPVYVNVTAADGTTTQRYVITIHRAAQDASTNNNLGNLTVSPGTLSPSFSASTTEYTLRLSYNVGEVEISAVAAESANATLSGTGTKSLNVGANECKIIVVAQSGAEKVYTIVITREMDARLATLSAGAYTLDQPFDPDTASYTVSQVAFEVTELPLTYTPKTEGAAITVAGNTLGQGTNTVAITVKTSDGTEKTYTLSVPKAANPSGSSDNALKALSLSAPQGSHASNVPVLSPAFNPETLSYTVNGWTNGASIIINAETNDEKAVLRGDETQSLKVGDNALAVTVTAENGDVRTYAINVYRKSSDAGIGTFNHQNMNPNVAIVHSDGGLLANIGWEGFGDYPSESLVPPIYHDDGSVERHIEARYSITWAGIRVTPNPGATVTASTIAINANGEYKIDPLEVGANTIRLTVTAEDGVTSQVHIYIITRDPPPLSTDGTLKSIEVTGADLASPFDPAVLSYRVYAGSETTSVTITAEVNDSAATMAATVDESPAGTDQDGTLAVTVDLPEKGVAKTLKFTVTAENPSPSLVKTYAVTVIRIDSVESGEFGNLSLLEGALVNMPANTPQEPYAITLSSALSFTDVQANLATALNNGKKYVTADLSAVTGTPANGAIGGAYLVGIRLPSNITAIPNNFFANCVNLTSFDWASYPSLVSIGTRAFENTGLSSVVLPAGITSLGEYAFTASKLLASADISALPVAEIAIAHIRAFAECEALETFILPAGATSWATSSNAGLSGNYSSLKKLVLPAGLASINYAFRYCRADLVFDVSGNTKYSAILDGKALVDNDTKTLLAYPSAKGVVTIPDGIFLISRYAFEGSSSNPGASITKLVIPDSLTELPANGFQYCSELQSIVFGSGLTAIPASCFANCVKLGPITIPGNIKTIGDNAFYNSGNAEDTDFRVTLGEGVETLGNNAFYSPNTTYSIKSINIPASLTTIYNALQSNKNLISVDMSQSTLTTLTVSSGVFSGCSALTEVTLPPNLQTIGPSTFSGCTALTRIELPSTLTSLETAAFQRSGLTSVTLPAGVAAIPATAFALCASLEWVKILKTDDLVTLPYKDKSFPITKTSSTYPLIYVPDNLFTRYAGDVSENKPSEWFSNTDVTSRIRHMSDFATDYPGQ